MFNKWYALNFLQFGAIFMPPTLWIFHSSFVCLSPLLTDWKKVVFSSYGKGSQPSQLPDQTKSSKTFTTSAEKFGFNEKSRRRLSSLEQCAWPGKRTLLSGPAKGDHEQSGRFYQKQFYAMLSTPLVFESNKYLEQK